nr:transcriptional regulator [Nocardia sp. BMG51109]
MPQIGTLSQRRAALEQEWARWAPAHAVPAGQTVLRREVVQSWRRSLPTVDPACPAAPADDAEIVSRWAHSPLREPVTDLADDLRSIADDSGFVAAVTDERGTILWSCGGRVMRRRAEQVNFAPGGRWDETHMGTNALSLALRTGEPSTVFSAEHLVAALHGWVCYCAPIHATDGQRLGVLDLSTTWDRSHPLAMSTVRALVTAIESRLPAELSQAGAGGEPDIRLRCLGDASLTRAGGPVRLRPRQIEILTLLALEPEGFTPGQLHAAVYGDRPVSASTLKADVSHLRNATGGDITSRRYALARPISCDAVDLLGAVATGDLAAALRLYRGPLLPGSDTPGIARWRDHLAVGLRAAVLNSGSAAYAVALGARCPDDAEIHEHALRLLSSGDPRRAVVTARLHTALHD